MKDDMREWDEYDYVTRIWHDTAELVKLRVRIAEYDALANDAVVAVWAERKGGPRVPNMAARADLLDRLVAMCPNTIAALAPRPVVASEVEG